MPTYIFGKDKLKRPVFLSVNFKKRYLMLAEGIKMNAKGDWDAILLQEIKYHIWLNGFLQEGIRYTLSDNTILTITYANFILFRKIRIRIGNKNIKGKHISKNKIKIQINGITQ